jgi:glucose/arabinose dehydrogenase
MTLPGYRLVLAALAALAAPVSALDLVGSGFAAPLFLAAPGGDPRLFVVEKAGVVKVRSNGVWSTFLDISPAVNADGERGLLGLAFDPHFAVNDYIYVYYSDKTTNRDSVVMRYQVSAGNPDRADLATAHRILTIAQPAGLSNHKGGWIGFRPGEPGNLYIATGDGGGSNDPGNNGQTLGSQLGKLLRVDIRNDAFPADANANYAIPADNPFAGGAASDDAVWAYGLRNPFRASFDRQTGSFWIADVGQGAREEINFEAAQDAGGRNYGWRVFEGTLLLHGPAIDGTAAPIFEYPHDGAASLGASIIGGYVYRGGAAAGLDGAYFFGDFVSGRIFSFRYVNGAVVDFTERTAELGAPFGLRELTSFGEDGFGGLYVMGLDGNVYLIAAGVPEPSTYALLGLGLLVVGVAARRRRGKRDA